jgi:hypothetical protein
MQAGYVFPIGDEPCDRAWTGFLSHDESAGRGYILVFRELYNDQVTGRIRLPFLGGRTLATLDLMSGASDEWAVGDDGMAEFSLAEPGTFLWAKYELR